MPIGTILIGSLVIGGGLAGGALLSRTIIRLKEAAEDEVSDEDIEIIEIYDPWAHVDIEAAMPSSGRFPQGWDVREEGKDAHLGTGPQYAAMWRTLELKAPDEKGHQWVGVMSLDSRIAPEADSEHISGYFTAPSQAIVDEAKDKALGQTRGILGPEDVPDFPGG